MSSRASARLLPATVLPVALPALMVIAVGCIDPRPLDLPAADPAVTVSTGALGGENQAASNLGAVNMAGMNMAGMNLTGPNMGGTNMAGMNMAGMNYGGTNFGGNNLGANNMAATNMAGMNMAGMNMAGMNMAGMNLGSTNMAGSNMAGMNMAGMNMAGMNMAGMNLAGPDSGQNIHGLSQPINGMLRSGEDLYSPKDARCIVLGIGSTAFARLLAQQSPGARMTVALGKLPWGFAQVAGGPMVLEAWEAVAWGDRSYCTFVVTAPPGSNWLGVAGFIKAIFRWNAPPAQQMDIGAIDSSASIDPTVPAQSFTYSGMMNAGARLLAGTIDETHFMAGELAFITATVNNQSVMVDFSSWVEDATGNGLVLGNVDNVAPPTYAESVYFTYQNPDGTFGVSISSIDVVSAPVDPLVGPLPLPTNAYSELSTSYLAYRRGYAPKPSPIRCGAGLFLNTPAFGEPVPPGKCDTGLTFTLSSGGYPSGYKRWNTVPGTTAPMNASMLMKNISSTPFMRAATRPILAETYIFMWDPNHVLPTTAAGPADGDRAMLGVALSSAPSCGVGMDATAAFDQLTTGSRWCVTGTPTATTPRSLMYMWGASVAIGSYRLTSTDDQSRDPMNWTFQGCKGTCTVGSDTGWVTLDTRTSQTFDTRWLTRTFTFTNTTAYQQYRLRITANRGNVGYVQLSEVDLLGSAAPVKLASADKTENGVVHWTGSSCNAWEPASRAFDNLFTAAGATRWCVNRMPSPTRPVSLGYSWNGTATSLTSYAVTAAGDTPARDPRDWTFQGCAGSCQIAADSGWVTLDTRTAVTFTNRYETKTFTFTASQPYTHYRLRVTAANGDPNVMQIGELQLN